MHRAAWLAAVVTLALLAACSSPAIPTVDWPADVPPRDGYIRAWEADATNAAAQTLDDNLGWVLRFYSGIGFGPGWRSTTRDILADLPDETQQDLTLRLAALGAFLSPHWAKDNRLRTIDTRMLSLWGQAMRRAKAVGRVREMIDRIMADGRALLEGKLGRQEITSARYSEVSTAAGQ